MSTHERKMRKRRGEKFVRTRKPAKSLSPAEWEKVVRFTFDRPAHTGWGVRFMAVAVIVAVLVGVGGIILAVTR